MKKILFLDFDGVLNSYLPTQVATPDPSWVSRQPARTKGYNPLDFLKNLDTGQVHLVNEICQRTGAQVVVSSAWRIAFSIEELQWLLEGAGFTGSVKGVTPDLSRRPKMTLYVPAVRGDEVAEYIKELGEEVSFAALDDLADSGPVADNWVLTDPNFGLTRAEVEKAVTLLGEKDA